MSKFTDDALKLANEIDADIVRHFGVFVPKETALLIEAALKKAYEDGYLEMKLTMI